MLEMPNDPHLQAAITSTDLANSTLRGLDGAAEGIVVTPLKRLDDGVGLYSSAAIFLVKELRANGLYAKFLDEPHRRTFEVRKSAVAELVTLGISIGGSLTTNTVWFYIERVLDRKNREDDNGCGDTELEVTVIDPLAPPESNTLVLRGKPEVVLRAAAEISHRNPPPGQHGGGGQPSSNP